MSHIRFLHLTAAALLPLLALIAATCVSFADAQVSFQSGDLQYTVNGSQTVSVRHPQANPKEGLVRTVGGTIKIPQTVEYQGTAYTVTEIADNAFDSLVCITGVTMPDTITKIGEHAFCHCWEMKTVNVPESLEELGLGAFRGCYTLKSMTIPRGITEIKKYTFQWCYDMKLTSPQIPDEITYIGDCAFQDCASLDRIELNQVEQLSTRAFADCTALGYVDLGTKAILLGEGRESGVKAYGYTFENVQNVKTLVIPAAGIKKYWTEEDVSFKGTADNVYIRTENAVSLEELKRTEGYFCARDALQIPEGKIKAGEITNYHAVETEPIAAAQGEKLQLNLQVESNCGYVDNTSDWTIQGAIDPQTAIKELSPGKIELQIGDGESLNGLTITAVSKYDKTKTAAWHVNITETYLVEFRDWNKSLIAACHVKEGAAAPAPESPQREGYRFAGWSRSTDKVWENMAITARYQLLAPFLTSDQNVLIWNKTVGAQSYEIYRKISGEAEFAKIAESRETRFADQTLPEGKTAVYKIRACSKSDTALKDSDFSSEETLIAENKEQIPSANLNTASKTRPATPVLAAKKGKKSVRLSWKKVSGASGYVIYKSNKKAKSYKKAATLKTGKKKSYTVKKLKTGKTYYFKMRAYRTVKGKKIYSAYSRVVKVKVK